MSTPESYSSRTQNLNNLAATFHVQSIPLAIFILVIICLLCAGILVVVILCLLEVRRSQRRSRKPLRRLKTVYMDEISALEEGSGKYGHLTYTIEYSMKSKVLKVDILGATNLKPDTKESQIDAYASLKLTHESKGRWHQIGKTYKTNIHRRCANPRWHFPCTFQVSQEELKDAKLLFEVFDYDALGQDRSLGRLDVSLSSIDIESYFGVLLEQTVCLKPGSAKYTGMGELCIGLAYFRETERLEVIIYEARQLTVSNLISENKNFQISVRVKLRCKSQVLKTFETTSKSELVNPYFNEKTTFQLKASLIQEAFLLFELTTKKKYGRINALAFFSVGLKAEMTTGAKHWEEMIRGSPRTQVMWHTWIPSQSS